MTAKPRILILVHRYPQLSETYIKVEIEALKHDFEIHVVAFEGAKCPDPDHHPFQVIPDLREILRHLRALKPDILHAHYLTHAGGAISLAEAAGIPFTIRAHSFDTSLLPGLGIPPHLAQLGPITQHPLCLGVLSFPYTRALLERCGVPPSKCFEVPPVVDFGRFHDESPNSGGVMNTGACLPKKKMEDFLQLARMTPEMEFDLLPVGYLTPDLIHLNEQLGHPVRISPPVPFHEMPGVYKRHSWLVYTASLEIGKVGWPMAIAEAQAAGLGICMANLRPDLADYLGGAGYLYDTLEEVRDILREPYPEAMRKRGFENARRSDIHTHKHILTDLWAQALS